MASKNINANKARFPKIDRVILSAQLFYAKGQNDVAKKILSDAARMEPDDKEIQTLF